jgi:hypothetical protein
MTNQQKLNILRKNKFDLFFERIIDGTIQGLISLFISFMVVGFLVIGLLHWEAYFSLPIIFITSFLISPILAKIKVGEKVRLAYLNWLDNLIKNKKK